MSLDRLLMIPDPTNVPPQVLEALSRPSIYHRGAQFAHLLDECTEQLQPVFGTASDVIILTSSSTGAMEAGVTNFLSPGDVVVAIRTGKFGERFGQIAAAFGAQVKWLEVEYGQAAQPEQLAEIVSQVQPQAVLLVQNETSTGVCQDVAALAAVGREYDALVIVDAVSSLGGIPFQMDEWGVDVVAAGSQKALMLPAGLGFVAVSPRAWAAAEQATMPNYYFDLLAARQSRKKGQTPYTPNMNMIVALREALRLIHAEGLEAVYQRHEKLAQMTRAAMQALDLELFAEPDYASAVVTSVVSPAGLDSTELVHAVDEKHNILVSGGQGELKGRIFRIGHLGWAGPQQIYETIAAVADGLNQLGHQCDAEQAAQAAQAAAKER